MLDTDLFSTGRRRSTIPKMAEDNRNEVKDLSHFQYLYGGDYSLFFFELFGGLFVPLVCTFGGCAISRRIILAHPLVVEDKENIQSPVWPAVALLFLKC